MMRFIGRLIILSTAALYFQSASAERQCFNFNFYGLFDLNLWLKENDTVRRHFSIPAGPAKTTLPEFVRQTGDPQRYFRMSDGDDERRTNAVNGDMNALEALGRMLKNTTIQAHWSSGEERKWVDSHPIPCRKEDR